VDSGKLDEIDTAAPPEERRIKSNSEGGLKSLRGSKYVTYPISLDGGGGGSDPRPSRLEKFCAKTQKTRKDERIKGGKSRNGESQTMFARDRGIIFKVGKLHFDQSMSRSGRKGVGEKGRGIRPRLSSGERGLPVGMPKHVGTSMKVWDFSVV